MEQYACQMRPVGIARNRAVPVSRIVLPPQDTVLGWRQAERLTGACLTPSGAGCYFREPMAVRPIVLYPDSVLLRATREVDAVDDEVRSLVEDMRDTLYAAPGIGLAANQVGVAVRVCIVDLSAGESPDQLHVFINPVIRSSSEGREVGEEGCLSFPGVTLDIERAAQVTVEALDLEGKPFRLDAVDWLARAILHECEHLDGQVFLRNISSLKRELVKRDIRKRIKAGEWVATAPSMPPSAI